MLTPVCAGAFALGLVVPLAPAAHAAGGLYRPLVDRALALFVEADVELRPYAVDAALRAHDAMTGKGARAARVQLHSLAYSTDVLRQIRLVSIDGGAGLQVLNFCIFPALQYGLPTFSADLVTLPGGHLVAIDCQPNGHPPAGPEGSVALAAARLRHRAALPDGGPLPAEAVPFFSPHYIFSRLPLEGDEALLAAVMPAFEEYLRIYLGEVARARPLTEPSELRGAREAQLAYAAYRIDRDPARPMLSRLFGAPYAERLIRELLFDLPLTLGVDEPPARD